MLVGTLFSSCGTVGGIPVFFIGLFGQLSAEAPVPWLVVCVHRCSVGVRLLAELSVPLTAVHLVCSIGAQLLAELSVPLTAAYLGCSWFSLVSLAATPGEETWDGRHRHDEGDEHLSALSSGMLVLKTIPPDLAP